MLIMDLQIDTASRIPIYRQLADQVRNGIARGRLDAGQRLPSVRELSRQLVINPNTVAKVYTELEREGLLITRPGLGVFVAQSGTDLTRKVRREKIVTLIDQVFTEAVLLDFTPDDVQQLFTERASQFDWERSAR
jgi:GntR family transcriptional regulator